MRIKNLRGVSDSDLEKLDSLTLETSKNHLIRSFLRNERLRVKLIIKKSKRDQMIVIGSIDSNKKKGPKLDQSGLERKIAKFIFGF